MTTTPVTLVKAGQVGRAVLENLVANTQGAQELLEAAKRISECNTDGGPIPVEYPPLKTMQQTFMDESLKPEVQEAFDPLRKPQEPSLVPFRDLIDVYDTPFDQESVIGNFTLSSGTTQQVSGMTNTKVVKFTHDDGINFKNSAALINYDKATGVFTVNRAGIIYFAGQFNMAMLPSVITGRNLLNVNSSATGNPLPYQNPTFLGTRGSNECEYRMSFHQYLAEQNASAIPDIYRTEKLFEGKFTHYDVAKMAEKRHGFAFQLRCNEGDKIHFTLERGRSIANFTGNDDLICFIRYASETGATLGRTSSPVANRITAVFLTD